MISLRLFLGSLRPFAEKWGQVVAMLVGLAGILLAMQQAWKAEDREMFSVRPLVLPAMYFNKEKNGLMLENNGQATGILRGLKLEFDGRQFDVFEHAQRLAMITALQKRADATDAFSQCLKSTFPTNGNTVRTDKPEPLIELTSAPEFAPPTCHFDLIIALNKTPITVHVTYESLAGEMLHQSRSVHMEGAAEHFQRERGKLLNRPQPQ